MVFFRFVREILFVTVAFDHPVAVGKKVKKEKVNVALVDLIQDSDCE